MLALSLGTGGPISRDTALVINEREPYNVDKTGQEGKMPQTGDAESLNGC